MAIFTLDLIPAQPNLNGNTEESLLTQLKSLMEALHDVSECISGCSDHWHGRNYIPQGSPEARLMQQLANDAWRIRADVIHSMIEELTTLGLQIQGGVNPHEVVEIVEVELPLPDGWGSVAGGASMNGGEDDDGEAT